MKERLKSILLFVLVGLNFILGSKILSDKKLWPSGYNFFITSENKLFRFLFVSEHGESTKTHLGTPIALLVNTGDQTTRFWMSNEAEEFDELFSEISGTLRVAFESEEKQTEKVTREEWNRVLNGKSLYFMYPSEYAAETLAGLLGAERAVIPIKTIYRAAVSLSQQNVQIYLEDYADGNIYRIDTGKSTQTIRRILEHSTVPGKRPIINYSFDLHFDKSFGVQKLVLAPSVPVYSGDLEMAWLLGNNPIETTESEELDQLLPAFRMNPGSVRQYTEANGTKVFVDNTGILKMSPFGRISYQSTTLHGMSLTSERSNAATMRAAADFADRITGLLGAETTLYLSDFIPEETVCFNYCVDGAPVVLGDGAGVPAVEIHMKDGALTSYTQLARSYRKIGTMNAPGYIETLDSAIAAYAEALNEVEIQNIQPIYRDTTEEETVLPDWSVEVKDVIVEDE